MIFQQLDARLSRICGVFMILATLLLPLGQLSAQQRSSRAPLSLRFERTRATGDNVTWLAPRSLLQPRVNDDRWFGRDKARHFGTSTAIQLMGYGALRLLGAERTGAMLGAAVVTAAAGIGKEVYDARNGGDPSVRDVVWDAAGLGAGIALSRLGDSR